MTDEKKASPKASHQETNISGSNVNTGSDAGTCFLDIRRSDSERLRVHVKEYRGRTYVDVRTWYATEAGDYRPSSKGVTIKPQQITEVVQALMLAGQSFDPKEAA